MRRRERRCGCGQMLAEVAAGGGAGPPASPPSPSVEAGNRWRPKVPALVTKILLPDVQRLFQGVGGRWGQGPARRPPGSSAYRAGRPPRLLPQPPLCCLHMDARSNCRLPPPPAVPTGLLKVGQDSLDLAGCLYDVYVPSPVRRPELVFTDSAHHRAPVNLLLICLQESSESLRKVNPAPAQAFYHAFPLLCMTQLNHLLCVPPQSALVSGAVCSHSALSPSKSERA